MPAAAVSTASPLAGARDLNQVHLVLAYEDMGNKIATLISFMNAAVSAISTLNVEVSNIMSALTSARNSGVTFSVFSAVTFTSTIALGSYAGTFSNLKA